MKKIIFTLMLSVISMPFFAQKAGDLYFGVKGGYVPTYKDFLYGLQSSFQVSDPFEIGLTFLTNPDIKMEEGDGASKLTSKVKLYSLNLDLNYYILMQRTWAMGPTVGGQYFHKSEVYSTSNISETDNSYGLNLGWSMLFNITDNVKLNGGWRYSVVTDDNNHHLFHIGLGYAFSLY